MVVMQDVDCRTPIHAPSLLAFFAARAVPGVEAVDGTIYRRSVALAHGPGVLALELGESPRWALERGDPRDEPEAARLAAALLDADADPAAVDGALAADPLLRELVHGAPGRRVPGCVDPAEIAVRAVLGQQVSVAAARTQAGPAHRAPRRAAARARRRASPTCSPPPHALADARPRGAADAARPRPLARRAWPRRARGPRARPGADRDAVRSRLHRHRPVDRRLRARCACSATATLPARDRPRRPPRPRAARRRGDPRRQPTGRAAPSAWQALGASYAVQRPDGASHDRLHDHRRQPDRASCCSPPTATRSRGLLHVAAPTSTPPGERDPCRAGRARARQLARVLRRRAHGVRPARSTPTGTPFQRRVWAALREIPYGETITYGELALRARQPAQASRAVGLANGRNPISIVVPCHRVIGADGSLTGYGGGLDAQARAARRTRRRSLQASVQRSGDGRVAASPRRREHACASSQASRSSSTAASRSASSSPGGSARPSSTCRSARRSSPWSPSRSRAVAVTRLARRSLRP